MRWAQPFSIRPRAITSGAAILGTWRCNGFMTAFFATAPDTNFHWTPDCCWRRPFAAARRKRCGAIVTFGTPGKMLVKCGGSFRRATALRQKSRKIKCRCVVSDDEETGSRLGRRLRELIFKTDGLSGWVCVGHADPQTQVR